MEQSETHVKTFGNPPIPVKDVVDEDGNTYCQIHTDVETGLRCNNCERLMCAKCANRTPVGYRCDQCYRQRESVFFNADASYYVKLVGVCVVLGTVGAIVASFIPFILFAFFIGAAAGGAISEVAFRFIKGQRGRYAGEAAAAGIVAGTLIVLIFSYMRTQPPPEVMAQLQQELGAQGAREYIAQFRPSFLGYVFSRIGLLIYTAVTAVTVYGRFNIYGRRR